MILITGLDGSGKSTILNSLKEELKRDVSILHVPSIELEKFKENEPLYKQSLFLNYLGDRADREGLPSLKIIAMFGSMLLFQNLYNELQRKAKTILCERHPLIDTAVYAKAYLKVMHPSRLDLSISKGIEDEYAEEMRAILGLVKDPITTSGKGMMHDLLSFLHNWFSIEENFSYERLKVLFSSDEPSQIYFLDAPSKALVKRLGSRATKEYHETEALLNIMRPMYLDLFPKIDCPYQILNSEKGSQIEFNTQIIKTGFK